MMLMLSVLYSSDVQRSSTMDWATLMSTPTCQENRFAVLSTDDDDHQQQQELYTTVVNSQRKRPRQRTPEQPRQQQSASTISSSSRHRVDVLRRSSVYPRLDQPSRLQRSYVRNLSSVLTMLEPPVLWTT